MGTAVIRKPATLADLLRRKEVSCRMLAGLDGPGGELPSSIEAEVEMELKYEGYLKRERAEVERFRKLEEMVIPEDFAAAALTVLSNEVREKLSRIRPRSLGQAARISGVTPAAISILMVHLERLRR